jgi:hypothetical protein
MDLTVKKKVGKFVSGWAAMGFLRRTGLHGMSDLVN